MRFREYLDAVGPRTGDMDEVLRVRVWTDADPEERLHYLGLDFPPLEASAARVAG